MSKFEQFPKTEEIEIDVSEFDIEAKIEKLKEQGFSEKQVKICEQLLLSRERTVREGAEFLKEVFYSIEAQVKEGNFKEAMGMLEYFGDDPEFRSEVRKEFKKNEDVIRGILESERDADLPPFEKADEILHLREIRKILFNLEKAGKLTKKEARARFLEEYEDYREEREWQKEGIEHLNKKILEETMKGTKTVSGLSMFDLRLKLDNKEEFEEFKEEKIMPVDVLMDTIGSDVSEKEMLKLIDEKAKIYRLTERQASDLKETSNKLIEKRKKVQDIRESNTDEKLFKYLTGTEPEGEVEIMTTPFGFCIRCKNIEDYARFATLKIFAKEKDLDDKDIEKAKRSGGVFVSDIVMAENNTDEEKFNSAKYNTMLHEEQHNIDYTIGVFDEVLLGDIMERASKKGMEKVVKDEEEQKEIIKKEIIAGLREARVKIEFRVASEVKAYLKEGGWSQEIFEVLRRKREDGGLYDYFDNENRESIFEYFKESRHEFKGREDELKKIIDKVLVDEYQKLLNNAEKAVEILSEGAEALSKNKIIEVLQRVPLKNWLTEAKRKIRKRKEVDDVEFDTSEFDRD